MLLSLAPVQSPCPFGSSRILLGCKKHLKIQGTKRVFSVLWGYSQQEGWAGLGAQGWAEEKNSLVAYGSLLYMHCL